MVRPAVKPEDSVVETWECAFPGTVWVWVYDRREDQYKKVQVSQGSGSRILHITRDDRRYNQELIPVENSQFDMFTNGHLRLVSTDSDRDEALDISNHYTNNDLIAMFEVRDPDLFAEALAALTSEVVIRRLHSLADTHATVSQNQILRETIEVRYPIGGTQKTIREMIEAGDRIGAGRI